MNPRRPEDLLRHLGVERPEEIDVEAIAHFCGATVVYEPLEGCEAQITGYRDKAVIRVNEASGAARRRFSAAHELGHWMLDRGRAFDALCTSRSFVAEWTADNPERRANRYAADLLLPAFLFRADVKEAPMTLDTTDSLARRYTTSITATAIRQVELGSYPALLACTESGKRKWSIGSRDVPYALKGALFDRVRRGTVAHDLTAAPDSEEAAPAEVAADLWFDTPNASRHGVVESSRILGTHVLSLIWFRDERYLLEFEEPDRD